MEAYELETPAGTFEVTPVAEDTAPPEIKELNGDSVLYRSPNWIYERYSDGAGMAFKYVIKEGVKDSEGNAANLLLLFPVGITPKANGHSIESLEAKLKDKIPGIIKDLSFVASFNNRIVIAATQNPPEDMLKELGHECRFSRLLCQKDESAQAHS